MRSLTCVLLFATACGGAGEEEGAAVDAVRAQRAPYAGCVGTVSDADGNVDEVQTYDAYGWIETAQTAVFTRTTVYTRSDDAVVSATSTRVFEDGRDDDVVEYGYDAHQHLETYDGYALDLTHDGDRLVAMVDPFGATFELDDCENPLHAEVPSGGGAVLLDYENTYASGCTLERVVTPLFEVDYEQGRAVALRYDGKPVTTTSWACD